MDVVDPGCTLLFVGFGAPVETLGGSILRDAGVTDAVTLSGVDQKPSTPCPHDLHEGSFLYAAVGTASVGEQGL